MNDQAMSQLTTCKCDYCNKVHSIEAQLLEFFEIAHRKTLEGMRDDPPETPSTDAENRMIAVAQMASSVGMIFGSMAPDVSKSSLVFEALHSGFLEGMASGINNRGGTATAVPGLGILVGKEPPSVN